MLETPHVIVASAIAYKVGNPYLALPLSFVSHLVLDSVPHWNPHIITEMRRFGGIANKSKLIIAGDVLLALASGFFIASSVLPNTIHYWTIIFAGFFGVLPDLMEAPYFFMNMKSKFLNWWIKCQKAIQSDASPIPGLLTQLVIIFAAIMWIQA